jgi:hypothetical protein
MVTQKKKLLEPINNKLVLVLRVLISLNIWSEVRFQIHAYQENSVARRKLILYTLRWRLIFTNDDKNFVSIS